MLSNKHRDVSSVVERGITNLEIVSSRPARRLFFSRLIHLILSGSSSYVTDLASLVCQSLLYRPLQVWDSGKWTKFTTRDDNRSFYFTLRITLWRIIRYKDLDKPQSLWVAIIVGANTRNGLCNLE